MRKSRLILLGIFLILLTFTRFYNLEATARFTEDESGSLVALHQIYVDKKLTLVGQVNEMGTKVFGSLTLYQLMPFAILGSFAPVSIFYGAAFWGVATALVLLYLGYKINKDQLITTALLILFWYPIIEMGRWAWNPNLIPFWIALGILLSMLENRAFKLLAGISLGLSVHNHYYSIFAIAVYALLYPFPKYNKNNLINMLLILLGIGITLLPFVIFDLRHPPGLFLMGARQQSSAIEITTLISTASNRFIEYVDLVTTHYTRYPFLKFIFLGLVLLLIYRDIKQRSRSLVYLTVMVFQMLFVSLIKQIFPHYLIPGIVFFYIWLIYPRKGLSKSLSLLSILVLIAAGILSVKPLINNTPIAPSLMEIRSITNYIDAKIENKNLKNVNLVVLSSPDQNTYGRRYRDLLLVKSNRSLLTKYEYGVTDNLFVVSTEDESILRTDPAYEIQNFRNGKIVDIYQIEDSKWKAFLFTKDPQ